MRQLRPHPWDPTGRDSGVPWCTGAPALGLLCALGEQLLVCAQSSVWGGKTALSLGGVRPFLAPVETLTFLLCCRGYGAVMGWHLKGKGTLKAR